MILYLLNVFDYAATIFVTSHGGIELNPVVNFLMEWHLYWFFKIVFAVPLCWWLKISSTKGYWFATGFYGLVALWHLYFNLAPLF